MLKMRKDEWTGGVMQTGYGMQGCALIECEKYREQLRKGLLRDLGATMRTFRIVSNTVGEMWLRIEGDGGVCLIPIKAKPEDIDTEA